MGILSVLFGIFYCIFASIEIYMRKKLAAQRAREETAAILKRLEEEEAQFESKKNGNKDDSGWLW